MDLAQGNKDHEHGNPQVPIVEEKIFTDEELHTLVDPILTSDDLNHDGYLIKLDFCFINFILIKMYRLFISQSGTLTTPNSLGRNRRQLQIITIRRDN